MPTNSRQKGKVGELCRFTLPVRVKNITNERTHWAVKARYSKQLREVARFQTSIAIGLADEDVDSDSDRYRVTLIRQSTTAQRMDGDGLQAAMKPIRDGIADALGIDDGSDRIEWKYEQEKTGEYAVEVKIERMA